MDKTTAEASITTAAIMIQTTIGTGPEGHTATVDVRERQTTTATTTMTEATATVPDLHTTITVAVPLLHREVLPYAVAVPVRPTLHPEEEITTPVADQVEVAAGDNIS